MELRKLTESERHLKDMISSLTSKTKGATRIKELEEKNQQCEARLNQMLSENTKLMAKIAKLTADIATKDEQILQEKDK